MPTVLWKCRILRPMEWHLWFRSLYVASSFTVRRITIMTRVVTMHRPSTMSYRWWVIINDDDSSWHNCLDWLGMDLTFRTCDFAIPWESGQRIIYFSTLLCKTDVSQWWSISDSVIWTRHCHTAILKNRKLFDLTRTVLPFYLGIVWWNEQVFE